MRKFELSEQFIKEAHKAACPDWRSRIEKEIPELFGVKLEAGKWYKSDIGGLWFVESFLSEKEQISYGFTYFGGWRESSKRISNDLLLATPEEVQSALEKEAVRRGFVEGAIIDNSCFYGYINESKIKMTKNEINYISYHGRIEVSGIGSYNGAHTIFSNGKWATIIPQPKEYTIEELTKLVGHEFKIVK